MKNFNKILIFLSILILAWGIGFNYGIRWERNNNIKTDIEEIIKTDTIKLIDTIIQPVPQYIRTLKTDTIITKDIDTLFLPIQQKQYIQEINNDTIKGQIKAILSGYNASLDTLQYNLSLEQKTLLKRKRWNWNITMGAGLGYDLRQRQIEPVIALTIGFGYTIR